MCYFLFVTQPIYPFYTILIESKIRLIMKSLKNILVIFISILFMTSCDNEEIGDRTPKDLIEVDSDLYVQLRAISNVSESANSISCIEIIYPVTIFTYDANGAVIANTLITENEGFSNFLDDLPITHSISISYPIAATLADGTELNIETNEELKESINNCLEEEEEMIGECEELIKDCKWKVGYSQTSANNYLGATFIEENGATIFSKDTLSGFGSWSAIVIENELYLNISLNSSPEIEIQFNRNWKVQYLENNSLKLTDDTNEEEDPENPEDTDVTDEVILHQYCDTPTDECVDFNFTACEDNSTPGFTEITLDEYNYCIYQILREDEDLTDLSFYTDIEDAENALNPIASDIPFLNTNTTESYFVRVFNAENETSYVVEITITVDAC